MVLDQTNGPEADQQLAQNMGHPVVGFASSDIHHPFPVDGRLDEGIAPERRCDPRIAVADVLQSFVGDKPDAARTDGADAVVQGLQVQALEVGDVPGRLKETIWRLPCTVTL